MADGGLLYNRDHVILLHDHHAVIIYNIAWIYSQQVCPCCYSVIVLLLYLTCGQVTEKFQLSNEENVLYGNEEKQDMTRKLETNKENKADRGTAVAIICWLILCCALSVMALNIYWSAWMHWI